MVVVYGKITFEEIEFPYDLFKNHYVKHNIQINSDDFNERLTDTIVFPQIKVYLKFGIRLNRKQHHFHYA